MELQKQVEERDERITTMQAHLDRMQAEKEEVQEARAFADEQLASLKVEVLFCSSSPFLPGCFSFSTISPNVVTGYCLVAGT